MEAEEGGRTDESFEKTVVPTDGGEAGEVGSAMTAAIRAPRRSRRRSRVPQ